ncbi:MAG: PIG-L family deacetylase [bacterium]
MNSRTPSACSKFLIAVFFWATSTLKAQPTAMLNSAEIQLALKKLTILGSVLYIGAHPDDENQALLSYFSKGKKYRTAYLSLTRGDGGQNLIGTEKGYLLGVLRTQELLEARKIDGAGQFFTRAIDFGYSKSPEETLEIWNRQKILSDVVWILRMFKPDVIITRFPATGEGRHGHHTASALLANEAFQIAGDPTQFPEQLKYVSTWQPKRLFWNDWRPLRSNNPSTSAGLLKIDVGKYNVLLGKSYTEIMAESRSKHKSQGFGARGRRGTRFDYLNLTAGEPVRTDPFEGIDVSWSRIAGGGQIGRRLDEIYRSYQPRRPQESIPRLVQVYTELNKMPDNYWVEVKKEELLKIIQSCAGLWIEAVADNYAATPGGQIRLSFEVVNRSTYPLKLQQISLPAADFDTTFNRVLKTNEVTAFEKKLEIPKTVNITHPYWLQSPSDQGTFAVSKQTLIGQPQNPFPLPVHFKFFVENESLEWQTPIYFRWTEWVVGEQFRQLELRPDVTVNLDQKVYLFPDVQPRTIWLTLKSARKKVAGTLHIKLPTGWRATPERVPFQIDQKFGELRYSVSVHPPHLSEVGSIALEVEVNGKTLNQSLVEISHPHILKQSLFPPATARLVRVEIQRAVSRIGYIMGPGDEIPEVLKQAGFSVTLLDDHQIESENLSRYEAIVTGIRAYNTRPRLKHLQPKLLEYVHRGGTLVVQYNVAFGLVTNEIGPYPFKISRDRVTVEIAPVQFLSEKHPLLNFPHKITAKDFDGWVQERGLYFANDWDEHYEPVLSSHDPGEGNKKGGLLIAHYGKGVFIYTGYSWFRQLPAGVAGAVRLFVNLISAGKYHDKKN